MKIQYGEEIIEYKVEYRDRKTFEIRIEPPDNIRLRVPKKASEKEIIKIVESKAKWISQKLSDFKDMDYRIINRDYINGESFMYLGKDYPLKLVDNEDIKKPMVKLFQEEFSIETNTRGKEILRQAMENWYRKETLELVSHRVRYFKNHIGKEPKTIRAKEQKKRWGSCNIKGDLMFNWRISMALSDVLDYIVVHEMCHLMHFNHSKEFWTLLEEIIPDYRDRKDWLKRNGFKMEL